jgi:hypothetical protein
LSKIGIFSFGVLANNTQIDVIVSSFIARYVLDQDDGGVDIKFLSQSNIEGLMARALDGCVQDSLQAKLIAFQRCN